MPEHEFEIYLDLLTRLLRLKPEQRGEIADELRDHLQTRLDELTAAGVPREKAVRRALAEFGDAAGLASEFTDIARKRTRRFIMRCTVGTVAVVACGMLLLSGFWPAGAPHAPRQAAAQDDEGGTLAAPNDKAAAVGDSNRGRRDPTVARVEAKLDEPYRGSVNFVEMPLAEVLEIISNNQEVDILVNKTFVEDLWLALDTPVNLKIEYVHVSARTLLELVLEQFSGGEVHYMIRDGLIYLTSEDDDSHIEVYNVRDLLDDASKWQPAVKPQPADAHPHQHPHQPLDLDPAHPAGDGGTPANTAARPGVPVQTAQFSGGLGGFGGNMHQERDPTPADNLINVIQSSVNTSPWMDTDGTGGAISEFGGLLVIRTSQKAHREIKDLLEMMRSATADERRPGRFPGARFDPTKLLQDSDRGKKPAGFRGSNVTEP